ncbi:MAG: S-adenosylmethionine:tRNA ribosyltransferase-isomerase, partial [Acidimicrobiia bacterium]
EPADDIDDFLGEFGSTPLPPYFTGELEDDDRYQTMFATDLGSSAAPTAALHFTDSVVSSLADAGVGITEVTLDVGLDTFRPMGEGSVEDHEIHTERIAVDQTAAAAINACKRSGGKVIAVGTTVMRTLESAAGTDGVVSPVSGPTSLFITPGYRPKVVDALITNFHAPRTTLLVLISAVMGDGWRRVYQHALDDGFRFLSFGDAMYVEVSP